MFTYAVIHIIHASFALINRTLPFNTYNTSPFGHKHRHLEHLFLKVDIYKKQDTLKKYLKALYLYVKFVTIRCLFIYLCIHHNLTNTTITTYRFSNLTVAVKMWKLNSENKN